MVTIDLSTYDTVDITEANVLFESFKLAELAFNSRWLTQTRCVVAITKLDVFAAKLQHTPLTECFPDFKQMASDADSKAVLEEAVAFIKHKIEAQNKVPDKGIYCMQLCSYDSPWLWGWLLDLLVDRSTKSYGLN